MRCHDLTCWLRDRANTSHADVQGAVHFHRLDLRVARELESSVGKLELVDVLERLADGVIVDNGIGAAVFINVEGVVSTVSDKAIVNDEGEVFDGDGWREAEEDSFADHLNICEFMVLFEVLPVHPRLQLQSQSYHQRRMPLRTGRYQFQ